MIVLTALHTEEGAATLEAIKSHVRRFPGHEKLRICAGASCLTLGWKWRVAQCTGLLIALSDFGDVEVIEAEATT